MHCDGAIDPTLKKRINSKHILLDYERGEHKMKKVIITIAALAVSAAMIFSFAGCDNNPVEEDSTNDAVAEVESDSQA